MPIGAPRLQRLGLSHDHERQSRRLQARHREHLDPDAERRRPHDGRRRGARLPHLPRDGALRGDAAEQRHGGRRLAPDGVRCEPPDHRGLQQLPHHDADLRHQPVPTAAKPANHIPTSAPCAQCHTTAGNYALYSVTGMHQGVTQCLTCHGPTVGPFVNITIVSTPGNHIPIGSLDCNGSGCHTTTNVNAGGFKLGAASISARP